MAKKSQPPKDASSQASKLHAPATGKEAKAGEATTDSNQEGDNVTALITVGADIGALVGSTNRDNLASWMNVYMAVEVEPASNTYRAKLGDIEWFLRFFFEQTGGYDCDAWTRSLSKSFLTWVQRQISERTGRKLAPNTCRRIFDTVKRAGRWIHRQRPFLTGDPFQDLRGVKVGEPDWKGLSDLEVRRLRTAAEQLVHIQTRSDQLPRRNFAMILVLLDAGLRAFELASLELHQYRDKALHGVIRKGRDNSTPRLSLGPDACDALDQYIEQERREGDGPLFQSKNGRTIGQQVIDQVVRRVAAHANSKLPKEQHIDVSPHVLRHTSLRKWAEKEDIRFARKRAGHVSDRYIWAYTQPSREEEDRAVEGLWE